MIRQLFDELIKGVTYLIEKGQRDTLQTLQHRVNKKVNSIFNEYEKKGILSEYLLKSKEEIEQKIEDIFSRNKSRVFIMQRKNIEKELQEALELLQFNLKSLYGDR